MLGEGVGVGSGVSASSQRAVGSCGDGVRIVVTSRFPDPSCVRDFGGIAISRFRVSAISRFRGFAISRFREFAVSRIPDIASSAISWLGEIAKL